MRTFAALAIVPPRLRNHHDRAPTRSPLLQSGSHALPASSATLRDTRLVVWERIGTDLQSPFRHSEHQIQMEALCETIEKNLQSMQRDALGSVRMAAA